MFAALLLLVGVLSGDWVTLVGGAAAGLLAAFLPRGDAAVVRIGEDGIEAYGSHIPWSHVTHVYERPIHAGGWRPHYVLRLELVDLTPIDPARAGWLGRLGLALQQLRGTANLDLPLSFVDTPRKEIVAEVERRFWAYAESHPPEAEDLLAELSELRLDWHRRRPLVEIGRGLAMLAGGIVVIALVWPFTSESVLVAPLTAFGGLLLFQGCAAAYPALRAWLRGDDLR